MSYTIEVNGTKHTVDAEGDTPLLWVLRDILDLTGTKYGCGVGLCGACTVHSNGAAVRSCTLPLESVGHSRITTIEGIGAKARSRRRRSAGKVVGGGCPTQCGYCQGGADHVGHRASSPIRQGPGRRISMPRCPGILCRCGCYARIRAAIRHIAGSHPA